MSCNPYVKRTCRCACRFVSRQSTALSRSTAMFLNRLPLRVIPFPESASPIELPITGHGFRTAVTKNENVRGGERGDNGPYRSDFHTANGSMTGPCVNERLNLTRAHNNEDPTFNVQSPSTGRKEARKIGALMTLGLTLGSSARCLRLRLTIDQPYP